MKKALLSTIFLCAAAAIAGDAFAAGPCPHYHDSFSCNADWRCFWDDEDYRCEDYSHRDPTYCGRIYDQSSCDGTQGCFWDNDDARCEHY